MTEQITVRGFRILLSNGIGFPIIGKSSAQFEEDIATAKLVGTFVGAQMVDESAVGWQRHVLINPEYVILIEDDNNIVLNARPLPPSPQGPPPKGSNEKPNEDDVIANEPKVYH